MKSFLKEMGFALGIGAGILGVAWLVVTILSIDIGRLAKPAPLHNYQVVLDQGPVFRINAEKFEVIGSCSVAYLNGEPSLAICTPHVIGETREGANFPGVR